MIESVRVPGTRSDPEFDAVRNPPWDAPFTCRFRFPWGPPGLNQSVGAQWWSERASQLTALGATVREAADSVLVSTDHDAHVDELPETTIIVVPSFARLLSMAAESADRSDFESWIRDEVLNPSTVAGGSMPSTTWRYDLTLEGQSAGPSPQLFVWPEDPETLTVAELLGAPHLPDLPDQPDFSSVPTAVEPLARELWNQVDRADATYRLSLVHRALDAIAMLRRGTDPQVASRVGVDVCDELRELSKGIRATVLRSGWHITGYADALLWPITIAESGEVPKQFVSDLAIDLLRRAQVVPLPPAPDLEQWRRRLVELDSLRTSGGVR